MEKRENVQSVHVRFQGRSILTTRPSLTNYRLFQAPRYSASCRFSVGGFVPQFWTKFGLQMAPNFLLLTEQAIDSANSLTSGENEQLFKLNKHQCKYVAQKLSESREVLQVLKSEVGESVVCNCEAALK